MSASVAATTIPVTDEDRVRTLLADNDRRLKQSAIAAQLEWSDSKTSRVLSSMADEGTVEKLRIGRENVIDLADRDSGDAE
ncbi:helix-turn-helix transcriptional regulator [Natronoarchaeum sp. GCM10025703]|uniref:helix-turn-helix transcriptional regulator n=1 Tax=Natronoarchaeum sp. GCM10025703 TaxID=3252685 RepID=UPI00360EA6BC